MSFGHFYKTLNTTTVSSRVTVKISSLTLTGNCSDKKFMVWLQRKGKSRGTGLIRSQGSQGDKTSQVRWDEDVSMSCTLYKEKKGSKSFKRKKFSVVVIWNSCNEEAPGQEFGRVEIDLSKSSEMRSYSLDNCSDGRATIALEVSTVLLDEDDVNSSPTKNGRKKPVGGFVDYSGDKFNGESKEADYEDENTHQNYSQDYRHGGGGFGYPRREEEKRVEYEDYSYPIRDPDREPDRDQRYGEGEPPYRPGPYYDDRRGDSYSPDAPYFNDRRSDDYDDRLSPDRGSPSSYNGTLGQNSPPRDNFERNTNFERGYERVYEDDGFGMRQKGSPSPVNNRLSPPPGMGMRPGMNNYDDQDRGRDRDRDRDWRGGGDRSQEYFDVDDDEFGVNREYLGDPLADSDIDEVGMEEIKDDIYGQSPTRNTAMHKQYTPVMREQGEEYSGGPLPKPKIEDAWA
ncbi:hypothetical protein TL16_g10386 [Triparma laevis f. inornata]|uniref:C2 NT-type domain-containing protein n=1 Tax=Triparma laevis f. inornata TaxID=1714386 RepID=A0A9W7EPE2_9STRA|nr:hypothetical protein TL16_g10386 [Triparma laevis f. inornata]